MVKGNTRRVVVVRAPDEKFFEQAIFLLREDALTEGGVSDLELLREAQNVCRNKNPKNISRCQKFLWFVMGAGLCSIIWIGSTIFAL